jgi:hypothetical protein
MAGLSRSNEDTYVASDLSDASDPSEANDEEKAYCRASSTSAMVAADATHVVNQRCLLSLCVCYSQVVCTLKR